MLIARLALSGGPAWGLIGAGSLLLVAVALTGWQLLETRQALGKCEGKIESADGKAADNAEAVEIIRDRLVTCLDDHAADLLAQRDADREHARRIEQLTITVARERAARDRLYETDDDCAAGRACRVCEPIAERLRDTAKPGPESERGRGSGANADPARARRAN